MEEAGLTGKQAAHLLGVSPSFVSMLLSGKRGTSELDIAAFLGVCRVKGSERDRLLALCREQDTPGWFQQHGTRLPKQLMTLIDHENKAVAISDFQPMVVPGPLQTGDYARALIRETGIVPPGEIDDRVAARLARQSLFSRDRPAQFTYYLHEFALRLPVGGPAVMIEQLDHLLRMSRRSYLTLRVVPAARGDHTGIAGPFMLMEFTEFKPVAYLDSETACLFLEKPEEISAYRRILAALADTALGEGESRELIAALATGLCGSRGIMMTAPEPDGIVWLTSSYSTNEGSCVQVGWRTSSYSTDEGSCVEVAPAPDRVLVRDSKDPDGPALAVPIPAWRAFLATVTR